MLIAKNIKEALKEATGFSRGTSQLLPECYIHHQVANMISNDIDVDNLILAYKISLNNYEKEGHEVLPFIAVIPDYINKTTTREFAYEFRKKYITEILGLESQPDLDSKYECKELEEDLIDISNKNKYAVLAALYNHSIPKGLGFGQYDPTEWDERFAEAGFKQFGEIHSDGSISFKYVLGRVMNCTFKDNLLYAKIYNQENGNNLAQLIVSSIPDEKEKTPPKTLKKEK